MLNHCKHTESLSNVSMAFFDSIEQVPAAWDELVLHKSLYLSSNYLQSIENTMKDELVFRYILFFKDNQAVALAAFQIITVDTDAFEINCFVKKNQLFGKVLKQVKVNCLINGTLFSSGEYGFYYGSALSDKEAFKALTKATKRLCALEETKNKIHLIMVKEYFPENKQASDLLKGYKYRGFKMEPNMVLDMRSEWNSMEDYFKSMTSRYRRNAVSILKKSSEVKEKELSLSEIIDYQSDIKELFNAVHTKAKVKLVTLDVFTFVELKQRLAQNFIFKAYFLENKMIGFSTGFLTHNVLDANYVGLDYDYNRSHGIYLRILYDLVSVAIDNNVQKLNFGRTAGEIKSNLGAKSVDMECYVRTKNSVSNKIIKPFLKRISTPDFVERNPFKG